MNYPEIIYVDTDLVGSEEPYEGWQRYQRVEMAKPATPNPKAEKLRTIENLLVSYHPMRPDLKDAADEIDRLTAMLQKAETQIKERDAKIDGLTIDRKYLCEYIRSADSSKYGIICNITSKDLAEPIEKYMEEEVSQKEFETEFGKHS